MRGRHLSVLSLIVLTALIAPSAARAHGIHGEAETIPEFIRLGIRHMVAGWDHLLFIAGVVLVAGEAIRAAKLVSLFVAGHSLTLLIATLAGWQLNAELVDVVIALSLAYVGWRIIAGRPSVWLGTQVAVFGFGLVHGLGLSTRLQDQPLPGGGRLVVDILAFNLGVEIGQLAALSLIVAGAYLISRYLRQWLPRQRLAGVALMALGLIAAAALGFAAARPDDANAEADFPEEEAQCFESQQTPAFEPGPIGGHPKPFHDVGDAAQPGDLQHVMQDGFVVVRYRPDLPEEQRAALAQWSATSAGVVVTPATEPQTPAVSAQTIRLSFTCESLSIEALDGFRSRWFGGQ
jgi:hydrogenase/urease accessory protein HupE